MEQKSIEYLKDTLVKWPTVNVWTVPGVMYQVFCTNNNVRDNAGDNIEYRFHWFLDSTETYVHNHRYSFDSYCLEGEYEETLWDITDDASGTITYKFPRTSGNKLGSVVHMPGALHVIDSRHHFPGNVLHVDPHQFHSISPVVQSNKHVLTFVTRKLCLSAAKNTYILSDSETIQAPTDPAKLATLDERQKVYDKLQETFQRVVHKQKFYKIMKILFQYKLQFFWNRMILCKFNK